MLIDAAKAHGNRPEKQVFSRTEHPTQGMPTCRYCHHKFTSWEGLRDHIENQRCSNMDYKGEIIHADIPDPVRPVPMKHTGGTLSHKVRPTSQPQQTAEAEGHERSQMRASVQIAVKDVQPKGQRSTL